MRTFWALMRTSTGGIIRVTVQAENNFVAYEMMKAQYGGQLISQSANLCP
jgi:hypothetical protein